METRPEGDRWVGHGSLHPEVTLIPELQAQVRGSASPLFLLTLPRHIQDLTSQSQQLTFRPQHLERRARLCCVPPVFSCHVSAGVVTAVGAEGHGHRPRHLFPGAWPLPASVSVPPASCVTLKHVLVLRVRVSRHISAREGVFSLT